LNIEVLREIVRLLKDENLSEITVSDGESTLTVRQAVGRGADAAGAGAGSQQAPAAAPTPAAAHDGLALTAPLVGTFYRRPTPEDAPFVEPGQVVNPGDTVCLIEAMKVMNEIKAEVAGRLRTVMAEEGAPVEYGQVLFVFDPL
jgi:acetyl-CoA carboxylase biotin carboxyl carrier protein